MLLIEREGNCDLHNDLMKYVAAYEAVVSVNFGIRRFAAYTRRKVKNDGPMAMILDHLDKPPKTYGLNFLRRNNRLDCAFENIIIDYHLVYPDDIKHSHLREARDRLRPVHMLLPPFPILRDRTRQTLVCRLRGHGDGRICGLLSGVDRASGAIRIRA